MKKISLTIWARINELGVCELSEDEEDPSSYCYEGYLIGILPDQKIEGLAQINDKEFDADLYLDSSDYEEDEEGNVIYDRSRSYAINPFNLVAASNTEERALKAIQEAAKKYSWDITEDNEESVGDNFWRIFSDEVYGIRAKAKNIFDGDDIPIAYESIEGVKAQYTYEFSIPEDEEFDPQKVLFVRDRTEIIQGCEEPFIPFAIIYDKKILVECSDFSEDGGYMDYGSGILHIEQGYIQY